MLLSSKIKLNVFESANDILFAKDQCSCGIESLQRMIQNPEESKTFLVVEKAFLQRETLLAIVKLIEENKGRKDWINAFASISDLTFEDQISQMA